MVAKKKGCKQAGVDLVCGCYRSWFLLWNLVQKILRMLTTKVGC